MTPPDFEALPSITDPVSRDILSNLLGIGRESSTLEFKSTLDLSAKNHLSTLVTVVAAMSANGGYLVIGVDNEGNYSDELSDLHYQGFSDEASVRQKLSTYLPDGFLMHMKRHDLGDGNRCILIRIDEYDDCALVIKRELHERLPSGATKIHFNKGDIYIRKGTVNSKIQQEDLGRIADRLFRKRYEPIISTYGSPAQGVVENDISVGEASDVTTTVESESGIDIPSPVIGTIRSPLDAELDSHNFQQEVIQAMNTRDYGRVQVIFASWRADLDRHLENNDPSAINENLNRIFYLLFRSSVIDDDFLFEFALKIIFKVYTDSFDDNDALISHFQYSRKSLLLELIARIYAVGGRLTRMEKLNYINKLTLCRTFDPRKDYYGNWWRHALAQISVWGELYKTNYEGQDEKIHIIKYALEVSRLIPDLNGDVHQDDESIEKSICEFDVLNSFIILLFGNSPSNAYVYLAFADFDINTANKVYLQILKDPLYYEKLGLSPIAKENVKRAIVWLLGNIDRARVSRQRHMAYRNQELAQLLLPGDM